MDHSSVAGDPVVSAPDRDREIVPDAIAFDGAESIIGPDASRKLPRTTEGRIGTNLISLAWRGHMRWLDDGGR